MVLALVLATTLTSANYRLDVELPATFALGAGWLAFDLAAPNFARPSCPCARADVPGFDRFAIDSRFTHGAQLANATVALGLAGSALVLALDAPRLQLAVDDVGIASEAVALTGLSTSIAKIAFSRPYPYLFREGVTAAQQRNGVSYAAMWSGHTAVMMAAGVAAARLLELRGAPRLLRLAMWIAGPLLALGAGALELSQGNHFPSDVLVGAAMGAGIGWGVVALHAR